MEAALAVMKKTWPLVGAGSHSVAPQRPGGLRVVSARHLAPDLGGLKPLRVHDKTSLVWGALAGRLPVHLLAAPASVTDVRNGRGGRGRKETPDTVTVSVTTYAPGES